MNTIDYLDQAKHVLGVDSDYALAARLGVVRGYISQLRVGKKTLSDEMAVQIATIIDVPPALVLADAHVEREKNPELKAAWVVIAEMVKEGVKAGFNALVGMTVAGKLARA